VRAGHPGRYEEDVSVGLLTIGAFARAAHLTPKALRLYDRLGLLPPAAVDPDSGYRIYETGQLERARLIARLRRIGMPLAEIRKVCASDPAGAAEAVRAFWQRTATDNAARARLAGLLVEHLSEGGTMSDTRHTIGIRYAAGCERGAVRDSNQDAAHASDGLLAVADGGGAGGATASTGAIDALQALELTNASAADLLTMLTGAVNAADRAVRADAGDRQPITTLTALLRSGSQLALVHIGDSRAYLLRGGELFQLTTDHTWVQAQVDQGRLNSDEAAAHPDRALLVRALGAGSTPVEADLALRTAIPGDRYLLCTDGLSAVVDRTVLHSTLGAADDPQRTVQELIGLAYAAGAPDNIACVIADVVAG
jgi:serine/threonine protein phosphatase PrpC